MSRYFKRTWDESRGDARAYLNDEYGGLGDQALEGEDEWKPFEITEDELETAWRSVTRRNRRSPPSGSSA